MPIPTPTPTPTPTPDITGVAKLIQGSEPEFLDNILNCNDYYAKLFSNNVNENNPVFTECSFEGYVSKKLDKGSWGPSVVEGGRTVSYYKDPVVWNCDDPIISSIKGYFITNESNLNIWYYKFPNSISIGSAQAISLTLRIVLGCQS